MESNKVGYLEHVCLNIFFTWSICLDLFLRLNLRLNLCRPGTCASEYMFTYSICVCMSGDFVWVCMFLCVSAYYSQLKYIFMCLCESPLDKLEEKYAF